MPVSLTNKGDNIYMNSLYEEYQEALKVYQEAKEVKPKDIELLRVSYEKVIQTAKKLVDSLT